MAYLLTPEADAIVERVLRSRPLLALDFDGTLAPIVPLPNQARAPYAISRVLDRISQHLPVAIVTGRSIVDVEDRLGFTPRYIIGNHGAEGMPETDYAKCEALVRQWRAQIAGDFAQQLAEEGIVVEDKGLSLTLHYRLARDKIEARRSLDALIHHLHPAASVLEGKCVVNLIPPESPDKFIAVRELLRQSCCATAVYIGDDLTDDIVFSKAPPDWLTIRIEAVANHRARFHLNHQREMPIFLQRVLRVLEVADAGHMQ